MEHIAEYIAELSKAEVATLALWLTYPHGSLRFGRVGFEAAGGDGILVRASEHRAHG